MTPILFFGMLKIHVFDDARQLETGMYICVRSDTYLGREQLAEAWQREKNLQPETTLHRIKYSVQRLETDSHWPKKSARAASGGHDNLTKTGTCRGKASLTSCTFIVYVSYKNCCYTRDDICRCYCEEWPFLADCRRTKVTLGWRAGSTASRRWYQ